MEVLIAVAVIASSLVLVVSQIRPSENKAKKTLRDMRSLNRTLYSLSRVQNRSYRLAVQLNRDEPFYWVEVKNKLKTSFEMKPSEDQASDSPFFVKDASIIEDKKALPKKFFFDIPDKEILDDDIVYINYNPHYFSNPKTLLIKKEDKTAWTLNFNPLVGELEILE